MMLRTNITGEASCSLESRWERPDCFGLDGCFNIDSITSYVIVTWLNLPEGQAKIKD